MADKHYVGEIGTEIVLDTSVDLTAGMSPKIKVKKPDGTTAEWAATVKSTTKMPYIIQALDFSVAGVHAF